MELPEDNLKRQKMVEEISLDMVSELTNKYALNQGDVFTLGAVCIVLATLYASNKEVDLLFKLLRKQVDVNIESLKNEI